MNHTQKIKEFEKEMAFCLNEYWYNLSPLEKKRYITHIHTQAKEDGIREVGEKILAEPRWIWKTPLREMADWIASLSNTNK